MSPSSGGNHLTQFWKYSKSSLTNNFVRLAIFIQSYGKTRRKEHEITINQSAFSIDQPAVFIII